MSRYIDIDKVLKELHLLDEAVYQYMKEEHNSRVASGERSDNE